MFKGKIKVLTSFILVFTVLLNFNRVYAAESNVIKSKGVFEYRDKNGDDRVVIDADDIKNLSNRLDVIDDVMSKTFNKTFDNSFYFDYTGTSQKKYHIGTSVSDIAVVSLFVGTLSTISLTARYNKDDTKVRVSADIVGRIYHEHWDYDLTATNYTETGKTYPVYIHYDKTSGDMYVRFNDMIANSNFSGFSNPRYYVYYS